MIVIFSNLLVAYKIHHSSLQQNSFPTFDSFLFRGPLGAQGSSEPANIPKSKSQWCNALLGRFVDIYDVISGQLPSDFHSVDFNWESTRCDRTEISGANDANENHARKESRIKMHLNRLTGCSAFNLIRKCFYFFQTIVKHNGAIQLEAK